MEIGHVIAKYRTAKKISQKKFANELNVSASTVALWEINKRIPTATTMIQIADYFNISMDELFSADRKNAKFKTPNGLSPDCQKLLDCYEQMNEESKEIILGEARKLIRQQRMEEASKNKIPNTKAQ